MLEHKNRKIETLILEPAEVPKTTIRQRRTIRKNDRNSRGLGQSPKTKLVQRGWDLAPWVDARISGKIEFDNV